MSKRESRVLVVDDEPNIVDVVTMALRFQGFEVASAGTGAEALAAVSGFRPDLILLDVMLPDMEGFDVARRLGAGRSRVPIIFLTARDATDDKIRGLTLGGDDYVTKPFSLEELVARIRSILRRAGLAEPESSRLTFEDIELDEDTREVTRAGVHVDLTATEYRLLRYLLLNPRRVLTRTQLLEHVWDYDFGGDARVLETYVSYLRKKLDAHGPPLIHTIRGVGYALRQPRTLDALAPRSPARRRARAHRGRPAAARGHHVRRPARVPARPARRPDPGGAARRGPGARARGRAGRAAARRRRPAARQRAAGRHLRRAPRRVGGRRRRARVHVRAGRHRRSRAAGGDPAR